MKKTIYPIMIISLFLISVLAAGAETEYSKLVSVSLINQDPDPAIAGDLVEVRLGVENIGGVDVNNVIVELVPEYPFELVSGEDAVQEVGTLQGYQTDSYAKVIKYKVKINRDAIAGSYELKVKDYQKDSGYSIITSLNIDVESRESAEVIHIDKTVLVPGEENTLKFTINNVGSAPLRDMTFKWENEDEAVLPVGSDNTKYIKYIDIGESKELEYKVIADTNADPGLYRLDLFLSYEDPITGEDKNISTIAGVYIGGKTDFDIAFSESSNSEISFTVANIGSNPAYSVSVIIPEQEGWRTTGSNSMIIGNLDKGDYTVASFTLQQTGNLNLNRTQRREDMPIKPEQPNNTTTIQQPDNTVTVQIDYTDTKGERKTVEKEVKVNQQTANATIISGMRSQMQSQSFISQYKWYIIIAVVAVILLVFYRVYKKKKLENPDMKIWGILRKKKTKK
jgi:hypothetical protein